MMKDLKMDGVIDALHVFSATEDNPISVKVLAEHIGLNQSGSCPATRDVIRDVIDSGVPIGSNRKGYYIIKTEKEMQVYLNSLMSRQIAMSKRILAVYNAFHGRG